MLPYLLFLIFLAVCVYFLTRKKEVRRDFDASKFITLSLEIPRTNDKKELAAEQMFASLHGILHTKKELEKIGGFQDQLSFELASIGGVIRFFVFIPKHLQNFVEGQIYAQYPTVQIKEVEDYASPGRRQFNQTLITELKVADIEMLPIKTFQTFDVDPLAGITATLAKLDKTHDEEMWIQFITKPVSDDWHKFGAEAIKQIKAPKKVSISSNFGKWLIQTLEAFWKPPMTPEDAKKAADKPADVSDRDKARIAAIMEKTAKLGYETKIRIVYVGDDATHARLRMQAMVGAFKQFNTTNLGGFNTGDSTNETSALSRYWQRDMGKKGYILNIEELASLFHLPHTSVETPSIVWANAKTSEPPPNLPTEANSKDGEVSYFAVANFRGGNQQFGLRRSDRGRHLYIIGQTGVGKSGLLKLLTMSDIFHDQGFAVIDPHGDYATDTIKYIPHHRIQDVVYFNPADTEFPIAFNPLEVYEGMQKSQISSELVGVMKRMFDSWGPRLEYILRYTLLALLDTPGTTMLDITRMLTESDFRKKIVANVEDIVVKNFWVTEFASWNEKFATEAVAPVLNKVGAFTANPLVRNIIGQPKGSFNFRQIMDEGKILIVNLSRGMVGEDNAAILGSMLVTKIQLAAMSRANIPEEQRVPFYLYVDEFQNFATDSFAVILSEARKYGLNLTVANQYTSQMPPEVKDAVFGNVGAKVSFRVSSDDANLLAKDFEPQFLATDLMNLSNRDFVVTMQIKGEKAPAFSGTTLVIPPTPADHTQAIVERSRFMYAKPKSEIEAAIREMAETALANVGKPIQSPRANLTPRGNLSQTQQRSPDPNRPQTQQNTNSTPTPSNLRTKAQDTLLRLARTATTSTLDPSTIPKEALQPPIDITSEMANEDVIKPKRKRRRKKKALIS
jgi:Type IV secretion-system coupling protein DNA-binding domain